MTLSTKLPGSQSAFQFWGKNDRASLGLPIWGYLTHPHPSPPLPSPPAEREGEVWEGLGEVKTP